MKARIVHAVRSHNYRGSAPWWLTDTCVGGSWSAVEDDAVTFESSDAAVAALVAAEIQSGPRGCAMEVVALVEVSS